jgi:hypothetical protein
LDKKQEKELGHALRRAAFKVDFNSMKVALLVLSGVVALFVLFIAILAAPGRLVETLEGRVVGTFLAPSKHYAQTLHVQVRLEDGRSVSIILPENTMVKDDPMTIEVLERGFGPAKSMSYRFAGYVDEPA